MKNRMGAKVIFLQRNKSKYLTSIVSKTKLEITKFIIHIILKKYPSQIPELKDIITIFEYYNIR